MCDVAISALGSVYWRESPAALEECLASLVGAAAGCSIEVVLVRDGPIGEALTAVIQRFRRTLSIVDVVSSENRGLGPALNVGLAHCSHDLVARFDTDDIYVARRFAMQAHAFRGRPKLAVLGGWIDEFRDDPGHPVAIRQVPHGADAVSAYARRRCPVNHMTVMMRRSAIIECGSYSETFPEDYPLWARVLQHGYEIDNLPKVLAHARVGNGMYRRRGGGAYAWNELKMLWQFYQSGFISSAEFILATGARLPVRLLPSGLRQSAYVKFLRTRPESLGK